MGTTYQITYRSSQKDSLQEGIDSLLKAFLQSVSTYEPQSTISSFNQAERGVVMDTLFRNVLEASRKIYRMTDGAFDPTVGPLVNAWGFGYEKKPNKDSATIDSLLQLVGLDRLEVRGDSLIKPDPRIELDFSAIAKGYGVDLVADYLQKKGIDDYFVEIGGEIRVSGRNPGGDSWRIGIERPEENQSALKAILTVNRGALATSGNYRNFYYEDGAKYAHTISPVTGYPVQHQLLSASVWASDCMQADALATAFMVMGHRKAQAFIKKYDVDAYFIYASSEGDLRTYESPGLKSHIETIPEKEAG